jgi:hypothetical protein
MNIQAGSGGQDWAVYMNLNNNLEIPVIYIKQFSGFKHLYTNYFQFQYFIINALFLLLYLFDT